VISGRTNLSGSEGFVSAVTGFRYFTDGERQLYDDATYAWDVALLQLATPALGTPIKLAGADEAATWAVGATAWVSGWGSLDHAERGPFPDNLQAVAISVLRDRDCNRAYGRIDTTSFCGGHRAGGRDTCAGDSGGPFAVTLATGETRLAGATSAGADQCGQARVPGIYAEVAGDPMRSAIQAEVLELTGVDVVGTGGAPAD
jgi:secreted trypsin-like serine protease